MGNIEENLEAVRARIAAACARAGRPADAVRLLAVSKTYGPEAVRAAAAAGQRLFGENRVQEAAAKIPECPAPLLAALDRPAGEAGRALRVLVQVHVSGEGSKSGLAPGAAAEVLVLGNRLRNVQVCGLMTIPPAAADPETARPFFRKLRELRDEWSAATGADLAELSMGMTHDLDVAIEEGATFVRVGTGIFGAREKPAREADEA